MNTKFSLLFMVLPSCLIQQSCVHFCDSGSKYNDEVAYLASTISDNPDVVNGHYTPSMRKLIDHGPVVLKTMLGLMESDEETIRRRAQCVFVDVLSKEYGFIPGQGWSDRNRHDEFDLLWDSMGGYSFEKPKEQRDVSIQKWRAWLLKMHQSF